MLCYVGTWIVVIIAVVAAIATLIGIFNYLVEKKTQQRIEQKYLTPDPHSNVRRPPNSAPSSTVQRTNAPNRPPAAVQEKSSRSASLRQDLRRKAGYDEDKVNRLIDFERAQMPSAHEDQLMMEAIERWERDNR
jgi:hypothetical protein